METTDLRLVRLLDNQGFRELVSAHLFAGGVPLAPTIDDKHMLAEHAQEELRHFEVVATLHDQISGRSLFESASRRASEVPRPSTWLEAAVAGYLVDRAASTQLREYTRDEDSRLLPVVREILEHEHEHQAAAETALLDQVRDDPAAKALIGPLVARWYRIALSIFDAPAEASVAVSVFEGSVATTLAACGASVPRGPSATP